ncbi:MAG: hypothetical protein AAF497_24545, partial [Planctomycetota bacterium]
QFTLEPTNSGQDRPAMNLLEPWLTAGEIFLPGDYSGNGVVDAADCTVWRDNLGAEILLPGDTTPGLVSMDDFHVWRDFFGESRLPYGPRPVVPEPSAHWLMILGAALALKMYRKGKQ